jgi:hypothetical protein
VRHRFNDLQIKFDIPDEDFKRLLKTVLTSPYLTILLEVLTVLLLKLMLEREPNFKIIANFLLHRIAFKKLYHARQSF